MILWKNLEFMHPYPGVEKVRESSSNLNQWLYEKVYFEVRVQSHCAYNIQQWLIYCEGRTPSWEWLCVDCGLFVGRLSINCLACSSQYYYPPTSKLALTVENYGNEDRKLSYLIPREKEVCKRFKVELAINYMICMMLLDIDKSYTAPFIIVFSSD